MPFMLGVMRHKFKRKSGSFSYHQKNSGTIEYLNDELRSEQKWKESILLNSLFYCSNVRLFNLKNFLNLYAL